MKKMQILFGTVFTLLLATVSSSAVQPNVVVILADDIGWSDVAVYRRMQGLSDPVPTPNIDRLAANGMVFTDAHSPAAICAPTRFSMQTGSNPYRNGDAQGAWEFGETCAFRKNGGSRTAAEVAQASGYRTGFFGKMHFGGGDFPLEQDMPVFPSKYGYDYSFCSHDGIQNAPYVFFENDRWKKIAAADPYNPSVPGESADRSTLNVGDYPGANGTGRIPSKGTADLNWDSSQVGITLANKATIFLRDALTNPSHGGAPVMMFYSSQAIHGPHTPCIDFTPNADGTPHSEGDPDLTPCLGVTGGGTTADMIYELDLQVGAILDALEDPDNDGDTSDSVLTNTLILFTSDNGGHISSDYGITDYNPNGELRGQKGDIWEGGHRVPFIAMWGDGDPSGSEDTIVPGSVSDQLISAHDWAATMYALTRINMGPRDAMDAIDILPVLLGTQPTGTPLREFMIFQSQPDDAQPHGIRQGDYVLFLNGSRNPVHLYNLATDFGQLTNLIADPSEQARIAEMEALFKSFDGANEPRSTPAYLDPESDPPTPDPAAFETPPTAASSHSITMTAIEASDASLPVEYLFSETTGNPGASDSGWQTGRSFTDTGLDPETTYSYTVTARDAQGNTTTVSAPVEATTQAATSDQIYANFNSMPTASGITAADLNTATTGASWILNTTRGAAYSIEGVTADHAFGTDDGGGNSGDILFAALTFDTPVDFSGAPATCVFRTATRRTGSNKSLRYIFYSGPTEVARITWSSDDSLLLQDGTSGTLPFVFTDSWDPTATSVYDVTADFSSAGISIDFGGQVLTRDVPTGVTAIDKIEFWSTGGNSAAKGMYIDDLTVNGGTTSFESWAVGQGLDGSPGKEDGFDDDPDMDHVVNVFEWILGGNPLAKDAAAILPALAADLTTGLIFTFTRAEDSIGEVDLFVEWNADLAADWVHEVLVAATGSGPDSNGVTVAIDDAPTPDQVTVTIPDDNAPEGSLFSRLRASLP